MSRSVLLGIALAGIVVIAGAAPRADASNDKTPPDLSGQWRLDPSRSDHPGRPGGGGGWSGGPRMGGRGGGGFPGGRRGGWGGGGGWGRGGGGGGGEPGGEPGDSPGGEGGDRPEGQGGAPGGRMMRMPDLVRIEEGEAFVRLADSTGTAIEEIATRGEDADTTSLPPEVPRLIGQWKGDRLEVKHDNGRGGKITETYSLEDKGRTLVLKTKVEGRRTFEFKRVYQKVDAS